jgi:hypothetical protein
MLPNVLGSFSLPRANSYLREASVSDDYTQVATLSKPSKSSGSSLRHQMARMRLDHQPDFVSRRQS